MACGKHEKRLEENIPSKLVVLIGLLLIIKTLIWCKDVSIYEKQGINIIGSNIGGFTGL